MRVELRFWRRAIFVGSKSYSKIVSRSFVGFNSKLSSLFLKMQNSCFTRCLFVFSIVVLHRVWQFVVHQLEMVDNFVGIARQCTLDRNHP